MNKDTKYVELLKNKIKYNEIYKAFCRIFGLYEIRKKVETLEYGIVIEIRTKEQGHVIPHIHAKYHSNNISVSLINGEILAGNIPHKQSKMAVEWIKNNKDYLLSIWEETHGRVEFIDMNKSNRL